MGFKHVQVDAIAVPIVIDDSRNSLEQKVQIVQSEKEGLFENIDMVIQAGLSSLTDNETVELKGLIEERSRKRLDLIRAGIRVWDYTILLSQIVSGIVA